jgi:predicted ester cyclase
MTGHPPARGSLDPTQVVHLLYEQVWNAHDYDLADALFADTYTNPSAPGLHGGAAKAAVIRAYHRSCPDLTLTVEDLVATDDRAAARLALTGTDTGGLRGMPATGRRLHSWATEFLRIQHGRIVDDWIGTDWLGILEQLGAITSPRPPAAHNNS